jgi:four helix bundle protein
MPAQQLLDYERLEVYQLSRQLVREGHTLIRQIPAGRGDVTDQFRRVLLSVPLNIAEGAGEFAPREKARFYRIAKRSATECGAILDHLTDIELLPHSAIAPAKTLVKRITGALVNLITATETKAASAAQRPPVRSPSPSPSPSPQPASAPST